MVAPNGARRGKQHHPELPVTIEETVQTAERCAAAGADALHAHIRDAQGEHLLDAGVYRELQAAMEAAAGCREMRLQITTESAGKYNPGEQRQLLYDLQPRWASVALREMLADGDMAAARRLYHWAVEAGILVQHILYAAEQVAQLAAAIRAGIVPGGNVEMLFVLGSYHGDAALPAHLDGFLAEYRKMPPDLTTKFMVCAFGQQETPCLLAAMKAGGDCRIGFENNLHHPDGRLAKDNAERVEQFLAAARRTT